MSLIGVRFEAEMASAALWSNRTLEMKHNDRFAAITDATDGPPGIVPEESLSQRRK